MPYKNKDDRGSERRKIKEINIFKDALVLFPFLDNLPFPFLFLFPITLDPYSRLIPFSWSEPYMLAFSWVLLPCSLPLSHRLPLQFPSASVHLSSSPCLALFPICPLLLLFPFLLLSQSQLPALYPQCPLPFMLTSQSPILFSSPSPFSLPSLFSLSLPSPFSLSSQCCHRRYFRRHRR